MSALDADTSTLLSSISSQLHTASTWMTGPRSAVLLATAGQLDDLLAGKSAADIMGGQVSQQTDSSVQTAPPSNEVDQPAIEQTVPTNVAPASAPASDTPAVPDAPPGPAAPDAPTG